MESDPPVFFWLKREGEAKCKTVTTLDFDGLRAEQDGFTACLLTPTLKKNYNIFKEIIKIIFSVLTLGIVYDIMRTTKADVVKNDMRLRHNRIFL